MEKCLLLVDILLKDEDFYLKFKLMRSPCCLHDLGMQWRAVVSCFTNCFARQQ